MSFAKLFLQRHDSFHAFWLAGVWEQAADQQMRARPHPRITSIAWNIWHLTRAEDAAISRFLTDRRSAHSRGSWASCTSKKNGYTIPKLQVNKPA